MISFDTTRTRWCRTRRCWPSTHRCCTAQAEASVRALLKEGESPNTVRSYASALRYWAAWFRLRYRATLTLPVPVPAVLQFLVDHVERTADDGSLLHDLPLAIDQALVQGVASKARPGCRR